MRLSIYGKWKSRRNNQCNVFDFELTAVFHFLTDHLRTEAVLGFVWPTGFDLLPELVFAVVWFLLTIVNLDIRRLSVFASRTSAENAGLKSKKGTNARMMILDLDTAQPLNKCTSRKGADEGHPDPKNKKEWTTHQLHPALGLLDGALAQIDALEGHHDADDQDAEGGHGGGHVAQIDRGERSGEGVIASGVGTGSSNCGRDQGQAGHLLTEVHGYSPKRLIGKVRNCTGEG